MEGHDQPDVAGDARRFLLLLVAVGVSDLAAVVSLGRARVQAESDAIMTMLPLMAGVVLGFWIFGFLSGVLAVLKLTVAGYWSWWRVMLPFLAFLGHNAVYVLVGFLCFCWLKHEEDEDGVERERETSFRYRWEVTDFP